MRITPATPFVDGDGVGFRRYDGVHILLDANVLPSRPQHKMPIAIPDIAHVTGTGYGFPILAESFDQVLSTASGITGAPVTGSTFTTSATGPYYPEIVNSDTANVIRYEIEARVSDLVPASQTIAARVSQGFDWEIINNGKYRFRVEASDGTKVFSGNFHISTDAQISPNTDFEAWAEVDMPNETLTYQTNGGAIITVPFDVAAPDGFFEPSRQNSLLADHNGNNPFIGTITRAEIFLDDVSAYQLVGPASVANAATGKTGTDAT